MRSVYAWVTRAVRVASALIFPLYFTYYLWEAELGALWRSLRHVTVPDITAALFVAALAILAIYLLGRRPGWPHKNIYHWLVPFAKGIMRKWRRSQPLERFEQLKVAIAEDVDDEEDQDDEDDYDDERTDDPVAARWAQRLEDLSQAFTNLALLIAGAIFANQMLHGEHSSVLGMLVRLSLVTLGVSLAGLSWRYVLAVVGVSLWLDYTFLTQGQLRSEGQAAILGLCLVAWKLWSRWLERLNAGRPSAE